jgi:hypothetical protein
MKKSQGKQLLIFFIFSLIVSSANVSADVFINEFLANGVLEPESEWIELYNNGSAPVNLGDFNITADGAEGNFTLSSDIPGNGFIVLAKNLSTFNSTFPDVVKKGIEVVEYCLIVESFNLSNTGGNIELFDSSGLKIDNISYSSTKENVSIGRYPDGSKNIIEFNAPTPGANNDIEAPVFNIWVKPNANDSVVRRLFNVTVNITDKLNNVDSALINFNGTDFLMKHNGDLWYFPWDTSLNKDGLYDITVSFNDTLGFSDSDMLFNIRVNNSNSPPKISSTPVIIAQERVEYAYDVKADDAEQDILSFSLVKFPSGMTVDPLTGQIRWIPSSNQIGLNDVIVAASDFNLTVNQSFQINVKRSPRLIISDLDVKIDGKSDKNLKNNSLIDEEAEPGSDVEFEVKIENLFTREEGIEIEDIQVEIRILDIDDDDDLEEEADEFDLKSGNDKSVKLSFDIPLDADEDTYDVVIDVEGDDNNGTIHNIRWNLELEVNKKTNEVKILRYSVSPSEVRCDRTLSITVDVINTGSEDEDDVRIEILNADLGISFLINGIELDEGSRNNRASKTVTATIGSNVLPGIYPILITAFFDGRVSQTKKADLTVGICESAREIREGVGESKPEVEVVLPPTRAEERQGQEFHVLGDVKVLPLYIGLIAAVLGAAIFLVVAAYIFMRR